MFLPGRHTFSSELSRGLMRLGTRLRVRTVRGGFVRRLMRLLVWGCSAVREVCQVQDLGKRTGTSFFMASFGTLIGVPIGAVVLESQGGGYQGLIELGGAFYFAAFATFCIARVIAGGWNMKAF